MSTIQDAVRPMVSSLVKTICKRPRVANSGPDNEITQMEENIRFLALLQEAMSDEFKIRIAALSRKRNRLTSFHKLPAELHCMILQFYQIEDLSFQRLWDLASVCSAWFSAVKACQSLWTSTSYNDSFAGIDFKLQKSRNLPLQIKFDDVRSELNPRAFIGTILPHHKRIEKIQLGFVDLEALKELFDNELPALKELTLTWNDVDERAGLNPWDPLELEGAPSLERLELRSMAITTDWELCVDLTHLSIYYVENAFNFKEICSIFRGCRKLEVVEITGVENWHEDNGFVPESVETIALPRLRRLWLAHNNTEFEGPLLSSIQADAVEELHIRCTNSHRETLVLESLIHHSVGRALLASFLRNNGVDYLQVSLYGKAFAIATGPMSPSRCMLPSSRDFSEIFGGARPYTHMPIHLDCLKYVITADLATILPNVPTITNLALDYSINYTREVIKTLSTRHQDSGRLPCQNLEEIQLGSRLLDSDLKGALAQDVADLFRQRKSGRRASGKEMGSLEVHAGGDWSFDQTTSAFVPSAESEWVGLVDSD